MPKKAQQTGAIEALAEKIRHHRNLYYNGTPEISDAEFDALEDRLRELAPDHPVLAEVGAAPLASEEHLRGANEDPPAEIEAFRHDPRALARELAEISESFYDGEIDESPE